jgi:hypothetical protein
MLGVSVVPMIKMAEMLKTGQIDLINAKTKLCMIQQYTYLFLVMVAASHVASDNLVPFVLGVCTNFPCNSGPFHRAL